MTETQQQILKDITEALRPTREEIDANAIDHAYRQLDHLVHALSTDKAFWHRCEDYPHEYVGEIMDMIAAIRNDLKRREGTPGYGKLRGSDGARWMPTYRGQ